MQADLIIFPFVDRFALCAPNHAGCDVREACDGAIGAWLNAMSARPSCKVSCANPEALLQAYRYVPCLTMQLFSNKCIGQKFLCLSLRCTICKIGMKQDSHVQQAWQPGFL